MQIELVVFDIAGTTVVDRGVVKQAFKEAFTSKQIEVPDEDIDKIMGYHKAQAIRIMLERYYPGSENVDELVDTLLNRFSKRLMEIYLSEKMEPQPFAEELFRRLREAGIKVALNTGFTREITEVILQNLRWVVGEIIDGVICSDEVSFGRPYPFMIKSLIKKFNILESSHVAKCGDTSVDIQEGKNAECGLVVGITTGAFTREQLLPYGPDAVIDSLKEFDALLR